MNNLMSRFQPVRLQYLLMMLLGNIIMLSPKIFPAWELDNKIMIGIGGGIFLVGCYLLSELFGKIVLISVACVFSLYAVISMVIFS